MLQNMILKSDMKIVTHFDKSQNGSCYPRLTHGGGGVIEYILDRDAHVTLLGLKFLDRAYFFGSCTVTFLGA